MGLLAAKAAEQRSKYIVDKYHYGVECNTCSYDYEYYAKLDFVSDCFDVCSDDVTVTSLDSTLDCSGRTPTLVVVPPCEPAWEILDCNRIYTTREMQSFEINSWLYMETQVNENSVRMEFVSAIVNGVEYLSGTRYIDLTPDSTIVESHGSVEYIMNIVNFLNSLLLPGITFYPGSDTTMKVKFPEDTTWQITADANAGLDEASHGAKISQTGLVDLQLAPAAVRSTAPFGGSVSLYWEVGYSTISRESLC